ncbi:IS3 family transposase [Glaesserella parasuis]|uniref:Transposase n=1 Tax=Glaesserella parasuis HPS9 TaxID=1450513 RepID=A0A836YZA9_GLAPU|nr:IS3 family transposase [Glaesserella parasuis]AIK18041.1 transposase [Glaesserella parasuis]AWY46511.1 IS3 family transposase [Glaesserella parasuis 29755]EQA96265.1 transposase family protein [Glaesserella parasuis 29755]KDB44288.1 transposase [Glaesserella parasuis HPS9]KDD80981.1 transposase [Glaesserella parasuis ST4-1]
MRRPRRTFSAEFKAEAVKLITERKYSITQACKELDIGETALRRRLSQVQTECQGYVLLGSKPISPEQQRIRELENRIKELEEDKEILKKATAILMSLESNDTKRSRR